SSSCSCFVSFTRPECLLLLSQSRKAPEALAEATADGSGRGPRSARAARVEWNFAILTRRAEERYSVKRLIVLSASSNDAAERSVSIGASVWFRRHVPG